MDNAGDWLYIVFLIIAGISSLFGSKNKKKRPKQILGQPDREIVTNEDNVPDKGFWEILEEMQNPKPAKQPVPTPKRKKETTTSCSSLTISCRRKSDRQTISCRQSPCRSLNRRGNPTYGYRVRQCRRTEKSCYLH